MLCLFFFKQKTAYEMRISDWSSDVCSSDLDVYDTGNEQGTQFAGSCVGQVTPISGKQCIDLPWMDPYFLRGEMTPEQVNFLFEWEEGKTVYTQKTIEGTVSGKLFDQIGRASCRERVCQNV